MSNIIALDVGDIRVGVAVGTTAPQSFAPLGIYLRAKGRAEQEILRLVMARNIEEIVVGLPLSQDGVVNEQCNKIEKFCLRLQRRCSVKVIFVDEFASSLEASEQLAALKKLSLVQKKKKQDLDAISASIILQSYLENGPQVVVKILEKPLEKNYTQTGEGEAS